jgi:hypothetical protein
VQTKSSQLWIWLADRCSSHVRAESARCNGRLRMMTYWWCPRPAGMPGDSR